MKAIALALALLAPATLLPGCATSEPDKSAREWQRAECARILDKEDRERCLRRID